MDHFFVHNILYYQRNDPNSYDGKATHLIKVCYLRVKFKFNHVKPGNYKLFINQCFEEGTNLKGICNLRVWVCDKEIFVDKHPLPVPLSYIIEF